MIEVNNLTKSKLDNEFLKKVAKIVLIGEPAKSKAFRRAGLSIALVGQKRIRELNKKYRRKNKATNVLSFSYGEIVICLSKVKKEELAKVLIHGILHLLGFDHKQMKIKEDFYLGKI